MLETASPFPQYTSVGPGRPCTRGRTRRAGLGSLLSPLRASQMSLSRSRRRQSQTRTRRRAASISYSWNLSFGPVGPHGWGEQLSESAARETENFGCAATISEGPSGKYSLADARRAFFSSCELPYNGIHEEAPQRSAHRRVWSAHPSLDFHLRTVLRFSVGNSPPREPSVRARVHT